MKTIKNVEDYIESHPKWKGQLHFVRSLLTSFPFDETIKWGVPVYTLNNKNLVGVAAFKHHLALWFYQGALLKKNTELLYNAQENKTKALRQIRFNENSKIDPEVLKKYFEETIELHKQGKEIKSERKGPPDLPPLLQEAFGQDENFKANFENLSPGRQREYAEYIDEAKREDTKVKRLEKIIPMINEGRGLNDHYK